MAVLAACEPRSSHVFKARYRLKVARVDARLVAAEVIDLQSVRYRSFGDCVGDAMGTYVALAGVVQHLAIGTGYETFPVAMPGDRCLPQPTLPQFGTTRGDRAIGVNQ